MKNACSRWSLRDGRIVYSHPKLDVFWEMPQGFHLPSASVLSLAEFILLRSYGERVEVLEGKATGDRCSVAFSGGVDSAAACRLLPASIPIHTLVQTPKGMHKTENALLACAAAGAIVVRSNQDEFPLKFGRADGFYGMGGFTVPSILLSEHLGLRYIADGNILEYAFLDQGKRFVRLDHTPIVAEFRRAGLEYCMPNAGLTEISTANIARNAPYVMGCMRGANGTPCRNCFKCYRKMAIEGRPIPVNSETKRRLSDDLVPMLHIFLYLKKKGVNIQEAFVGEDKDVSWVDGWYPQSDYLLPAELRPYFFEKLAEYGIKECSDATGLETWISK